MKVALLGGSFNPIHNGHLQIANELIASKIVDQVWLIPCGNHAFDKELLNADDRVKMINLAIEKNPLVKVVGVELNTDRKSYSSKTIAWFKKEFSHEFYFVIGEDNLKSIDKWHDYNYLKNNVEFILVKRKGFEPVEDKGIKIKNILNIDNSISSSMIREDARKRITLTNLVPKKVEELILQERLYD